MYALSNCKITATLVDVPINGDERDMATFVKTWSK